MTEKLSMELLYVLVTGCKWSNMPEKYGSYVTAWRRLKRWQQDGIWEEIVERLQEEEHIGNGELGLDKVAYRFNDCGAKKGTESRISAATNTKKDPRFML
ncbi:MAG: Transposase [Candidatus Methanohalarchaeum thermophilum]|uniref:Transposase n=1 Tax=Methanohalarchaeum thermophilum TaxID=1903181 RepID=A0A1Q6DTQ9_METT1|nr:MAG: Transposase [Candidatus Methanohalarchaeum thermophilum]